MDRVILIDLKDRFRQLFLGYAVLKAKLTDSDPDLRALLYCRGQIGIGIRRAADTNDRKRRKDALRYQPVYLFCSNPVQFFCRRQPQKLRKHQPSTSSISFSSRLHAVWTSVSVLQHSSLIRSAYSRSFIRRVLARTLM